MSFCNSYLVLGIISIILIISIIILILYKYKYSSESKESKESKENFQVLDAETTMEITNNNIEINTLLNSINSLIDKSNTDSPAIIDKITNNNIIDYNFQTNVSKQINDNTDKVIINTNNTNLLLNNNITSLQNKLTDLENIINNKYESNIKNKHYSKIKSLNNGMDITLSSTPKTNFIDPKTGVLTNGYMVNINNGCLSVGATDYDIYKCNDENKKHVFKMQHIINEDDYINNIDKTFAFENIDKSRINYPFALIKSVNNNNCLTNQNGNITVQPCYSFVAQRWLPI